MVDTVTRSSSLAITPATSRPSSLNLGVRAYFDFEQLLRQIDSGGTTEPASAQAAPDAPASAPAAVVAPVQLPDTFDIGVTEYPPRQQPTFDLIQVLPSMPEALLGESPQADAPACAPEDAWFENRTRLALLAARA